MNNRWTYILPGIVILAALALSSVYIVDPREKALVLQFGQVTQVREKPGLYFKVPFLQQVVRYDGRILGLPTQPLEVTPLDDRRLVVDAFARWRITNLVTFRQATGPEGVRFAQSRLEQILNAAVRQVLGSVNSDAILSNDRTNLMNQIRDLSRKEADSLGIDVIDVRLTRTDLPDQNLASTYGRMKAERQKEAAQELALGNQEAQTIRATADRNALELTSAAQKKAEVIRGQADAERNKIYAGAYSKDPKFFAFYRSLQAYKTALKGSDTTMVLSPNSQFFDFLNSEAGRAGSAAAAKPAGAGN
ncbi:protease modulator HflC [Solirhodobacter olei]|uniref:protease modulator HflC n=1 Tax=Solirhodobacter olei TaxID=2493082 RepID=UPI000FDC9D3B|nr:protease modulator HflC [Solirhodobacter olei]